jgi:sulfur relay (sulfurtransferase) complex TusBCD TusD component (DsrE family)
MVMRIVVIVACSLTRHALHEAALAFVGAAQAARHNVVGVYLLQDGVELALAADEQAAHLRAEWSRLVEAAQPDVPMAMGACVGALGRRQSSDADVTSEPAASGFEPVGLGQIIAALLTADRVVEFRA